MKKVIVFTILIIVGSVVAKSQNSKDQQILGKWVLKQEVAVVNMKIPPQFSKESKEVDKEKKQNKGFKVIYDFKPNFVTIKEINYDSLDEKHPYSISETHIVIGAKKYELTKFTDNEMVFLSNYGLRTNRLIRLYDNL